MPELGRDARCGAETGEVERLAFLGRKMARKGDGAVGVRRQETEGWIPCGRRGTQRSWVQELTGETVSQDDRQQGGSVLLTPA